jgi:putative aminopeptidase FrvX
MHSPNEIVHIEDLFNTASLIAAFVRKLGPGTDFTPR